jgi:anti-sigma B factor antagonist
VDVRKLDREPGGPAVLVVGGEVDIQTAPDLDAAVGAALDAGATELIIELNAVTFLDSSGLGVLIAANKRVLASGGSLKIVCDRVMILKVFRITRLVDVFRIYDSLDAALAS